MDDDQLSELNFEKGKRNLKYMNTVIKQEIDNIDDIRSMITYKIDGDILTSIMKKLTSASKQIEHMISRFDKLEGGVMYPKRRL